MAERGRYAPTLRRRWRHRGSSPPGPPAHGDTYVVPRGRPHQPYAEDETTLLLFEPSETVNTGDTPSDLTAERRVV
jgi:hypothetical protein